MDKITSKWYFWRSRFCELKNKTLIHAQIGIVLHIRVYFQFSVEHGPSFYPFNYWSPWEAKGKSFFDLYAFWLDDGSFSFFLF